MGAELSRRNRRTRKKITLSSVDTVNPGKEAHIHKAHQIHHGRLRTATTDSYCSEVGRCTLLYHFNLLTTHCSALAAAFQNVSENGYDSQTRAALERQSA